MKGGSGLAASTMKSCLAVVAVMCLSQTAPADVVCSCDDAASLQAAGGTVVGEPQFVPGHKGQAVRLGSNACVTFPTRDRFDPHKGTVEFWVQPLWDVGDKQDHTFFHLGGGDSHFTVFRASAGTLIFVYKSDPAHWAGCNLDARSWKRSEWHHVEASWMPTYSGQLALILRADDRSAMQTGARLLPQTPEVFFLGRRGPSLQPAEAALDEFRLTATPLNPPYAVGPKEPVTATVDAARAAPFRRVQDFTTIWNNRENPLPFRTGDPYFRRFTEGGFKMARLVAFSEAWLWGTRVEVGPKGELLTDFRDFDNLLDLVIAAGAEPYVRLAYHTPSALTGPGLPLRDRLYALPKDLTKWDELMERIVRHVWVERRLPVRYWVAALNEGDIPVREGLADFQTVNSLYERTVRIVRRLDPQAKVGGPALARSTGSEGEPLLRSFLRYCRERALPLDFICFHAYHRDHPRDFEEAVGEIRRIAKSEWPEQADRLEYFLDEWNLAHQDSVQDNEYGASYLAGTLQYQRRAGLTRSSIVCFNHFLPTDVPAKELVTHRGPFDKTAASVVRFLARDLDCGGKTRQGILAHPPGQEGGPHCYTYGAYRLAVPAKGRPRLRFATGIASTFPGCDGCDFEVVVRQGDQEGSMWREFQRGRDWQEREVALAEYAGREITLELRTDSGPRGNASGDWAAWGEPKVVVDGERGAQETVLDLVARIAEADTGARQPGWKFVYNEEAIRRYSGLPLIKGPVVTAPYFVWVMYDKLGAQELAVDLPGRDGILADDSGGLTATRSEKGLALLLWHFDLMRNDPRRWTIRLTNIPEGFSRLQLTEYRIDHDHTNPYTDYVVKGKDSQGGRYNLETGTLEKVRTETLSAQGGAMAVQVEMPNMSVSLLEMGK